KLVINHDPILTTGEVIADLASDIIQKQGVPLLSDFFQNEKIRTLLNSNKTLWIELKPNCVKKRKIDQTIAIDIFQELNKEIEFHNILHDSIRILSFSKDLLEPFASAGDIPVYPIIPPINECNYRFLVVKAISYVLFRSLKREISDAIQRNYAGILFARQYLMGPISILHPSYDNMNNLIKETGIELGTNLGTKTLESTYPMLHRFTDDMSHFPRFANENEGQIIAHRGTGTKGITI
ncbi:MAG: hypothetical protein ACXADH_03895, partial [Candidatus Kariarchaeaceae archaeon]